MRASFKFGMTALLILYVLSVPSISCYGQESAKRAKDPTVPSSNLVKKLSVKSDPAADPQKLIPKIELRAIVLSEEDKGIALLRVSERSITVQLFREPDGEETANKNEAKASHNLRNSFQAAGRTYQVIDFSGDAILLRIDSGDQTVLLRCGS